jgi:hypothetical protein
MKYLKYTLATYVYSQNNICNIQMKHMQHQMKHTYKKAWKHMELDAMEWRKNLGWHSVANGQPSRKQQTAHADVGLHSSHKQVSGLAGLITS